MYCDRLAILHEGVLLTDDPPRQLLWEKKAKIRDRGNLSLTPATVIKGNTVFFFKSTRPK